MKRSTTKHMTCDLIAGLALSAGLVDGAEVTNCSRPNILLIYADDMGYGEVSCYNPDRNKIPTPNIDRLAEQGMMFTDAHSSSAVCSPSRYALLTGRYHWRSRLQKGIVGLWEGSLIAPGRLTLGGLVRQHGYQTAMVGKWHLGMDWPIPEGKRELLSGSRSEDIPATDEQKAMWKELFSREIPGGPVDRGFDRYFGTDVPNWPPFCFFENRRTVGIPNAFLPVRLLSDFFQASRQGPALEGWTLEPILPALGDRASMWIREYAKSGKPFFLYLSLTAPHTPIAPNEEWKGKSGFGLYGDFIKETDAVIGRVLAALEESGDAANTLVIFSSDNGCSFRHARADKVEQQGHFPSGPLRGYKTDVWEGGHRVPFIVRWPGQVPPGSVTGQLVHQADIFATVADILNHELPPDAGEDSFSLLPLFKDPARTVREHAISSSYRGLPALRRGSWKMIFGKGSGGWTKGGDEHPAQLYNLADDLGETRNLYVEKPELVTELTALMEQLVNKGRSTPGPEQKNDVPVEWKKF